MFARLVPALVSTLALVACAGGPTDGEAPEGSFTFDTTTLVTDAPAVGASWYDYDFEFHTVTPAARSYVVRVPDDDGVSFAAFRVLAYYDEETAASGRFTLSLATFDDGAWSPAITHVATRNVRTEGPVCLDVRARAEVTCDDDAWHVKLRVVPLFVPEAGIVVGNPSIAVRSIAGLPAAGDVRVATLADVDDLSLLPDPTTLTELADAVGADFTTTTWDRARLAPELPLAGMAIGTRLVGGQVSEHGDVFFLLSSRQVLFRFAATVDDEELTLRLARAAFSAEHAVFLPFDASEDLAFALPAEGRVTFARLDADEPLPFGVDDDVAALLAPPDEREWDLALARVSGSVRVVLSPACAIVNHTAKGGDDARALDEATP